MGVNAQVAQLEEDIIKFEDDNSFKMTKMDRMVFITGWMEGYLHGAEFGRDLAFSEFKSLIQEKVDGLNEKIEELDRKGGDVYRG